jgi:hypothetical protein
VWHCQYWPDGDHYLAAGKTPVNNHVVKPLYNVERVVALCRADREAVAAAAGRQSPSTAKASDATSRPPFNLVAGTVSALARRAVLCAQCFAVLSNGGASLFMQKTVEAQLREVNSSPNRSMLLIYDELVTFLGGLGAYKSGGAAGDMSVYLSMYNAGSVLLGTVKDGPDRLVASTYSCPLLSGIQPGPFNTHLNTSANADNGLIQRFMFVVTSNPPLPRREYCCCAGVCFYWESGGSGRGGTARAHHCNTLV